MSVHAPISVSLTALDHMMPMHVLVDSHDMILHTGPTIAKIWPGKPLAGRKIFEVFEPRRNRCASGLKKACEKPGAKIYLRLRDQNRTQLIGTAASLPGQDGILLNLSFGISVIDAVGHYNLAGSDFAPTDLTLEMLYLVEAKSAAMAESRKLNERLNGAKQAAEADASSDMLTGLKNRRVLDQVLGRLIGRGLPFTLVHLDLDFFKAVNDTLGHAAGDYVLQEVARILTEQTRSNDTIARVGGDEFVLVLDGLTDPRRLGRIAERLIAKLEAPIPFKTDTCRISASIGMTCSTLYAHPDAGQMLDDADTALYASKDRGRACYTLYDPGLRTET